MIAGFEDITEGEILLAGMDLASIPAHKRPVNTVFQSYALFPFLTVAENVAFGLKYTSLDKAAAKKKVDDALALVELGALAGRKPRQLSGGQQQRVALEARWRSSRACCCSTNRSARSTPGCSASCSATSGRSSRRCAPPSST